MAPPHKRRTREHVIADQSINYVERRILDEGHVALRTVADYGIDLRCGTPPRLLD